MTWIVVIGSSLVMLAWIVIYSFFESSDFENEVAVLFGEVTFWATVLVSVAIALGQWSFPPLNQILTLVQGRDTWSNFSQRRTCPWIKTSCARCG